MLTLRQTVIWGLAVTAVAAVWHVKSRAQENSPTGVITVFDHAKLEASSVESHVESRDVQQKIAAAIG